MLFILIVFFCEVGLSIITIYDLNADVTPKKADQNLKYSSSNTDVATVNKDGIVRGVSDGSASITLNNEDTAVSVAVVVNHGQTGGGVSYYDEGNESGGNKDTQDKKKDSTSAIIRKAEIQGYAGEDALKALKDTGGILMLRNEDCDIILKGDDIVNCENPLIYISGKEKRITTHFSVKSRQEPNED